MIARAPRLALFVLPLLAVACGGSNDELPVAPSKLPPLPPPAATAAKGPEKPVYPKAPKKSATDTYAWQGEPGGAKVEDEYRSLENAKDPAVVAWSDAENVMARKLLDGDPQRTKIGARVSALMGEASPQWNDVVAKKGVVFALERRPPKQQPYLVVMTSLEGVDKERVLVDPNAIDATGGTSIGWFVPSPDGKKVAVALAKGGAEHGDVHIYDVATGKDGKDSVEQAEGSGDGSCLAWKSDGSGFYYTHAAREANAPKDGVYQRIYFHKLGTTTNDKDVLAVGKDSPRIAQWELESSDDGKVTMARMEYGDGDAWDQWILGANGQWKEVATKEEGVKTMKVGPSGELYLLATK
ncbi:MAG: S9 family peptidase, partial [Polyangiaceae bacterium]